MMAIMTTTILSFVVALALMLTACAAEIAPTASSPEPTTIYRSETSALIVTGPSTVSMVAVACEPGEHLADGACEAEEGIEIVENGRTAFGWACAASCSRDGAKLTVRAECIRRD
jgi:hypothetical protein